MLFLIGILFFHQSVIASLEQKLLSFIENTDNGNEKQKLEVVESLLDNGALINAQDDFGRTPLYLATYRRYKKIIKFLLQRGANVNISEKDGWAPLDMAIVFCSKEIVELLLQTNTCVLCPSSLKKLVWINGLGKECMNNTHNNIFYDKTFRCPKVDYEKTALLLKYGAQVIFADANGKTLLHCIAGDGCIHQAELLIKNGARINVADADGKTPLHHAAHRGGVYLAELLIKNGAKINAFDASSCTPLFYAVADQNSNMVEFLLNHGAHLGQKELN